MPAQTRQVPARRSRRQPAHVGAPRAWWMLVHQLPPRPPGLRMRIWRRLQELGALQVKGSVYLLPGTDAAREDLQWLLGEIRAGGAEGSLWLATAQEGLDDDDLVSRFQAAAAAEYADLDAELDVLAAARPAADDARLVRLRARLDAIQARDHFGSPARQPVAQRLARLLAPPPTSRARRPAGVLDPSLHRGRTWITRAGVQVDRMASAWLIQRFIDPAARFEFVPAKRIAARPPALRFDTWGGEFTHEGDACTFEVLCARFSLRAAGLQRLAEIVHDIDLKEACHAHPETRGIAASLAAIGAAPLDDTQRIALAATLFDGLLAQFAALEAPGRAR